MFPLKLFLLASFPTEHAPIYGSQQHPPLFGGGIMGPHKSAVKMLLNLRALSTGLSLALLASYRASERARCSANGSNQLRPSLALHFSEFFKPYSTFSPQLSLFSLSLSNSLSLTHTQVRVHKHAASRKGLPIGWPIQIGFCRSRSCCSIWLPAIDVSVSREIRPNTRTH